MSAFELTQTELEQILASAPAAQLFATIRKTTGETEYRVKVYGANGARMESADCFETDRRVALETAQAMGAQVFPTIRAGLLASRQH